jgi:hypothetical protein
MKRSSLLPFATGWILLLGLCATLTATAAPASAADTAPCGLCYASGAAGERIVVPLESTEVVLDVQPGLLEAQVTQTFTNRTGAALEATYLYPLPAEATLTQFELHFRDRVIQSVVREKAQARVEYEAAKAEGKKAALLEQLDPALFSTAVANFLPGETVRVVIRFIQPVALTAAAAEIRFPMTTGVKYFPPGAIPGAPGTAAPTPPKVDASTVSEHHYYAFDVLVSGFPECAIECPSHAIKVEGQPGGRKRVALAEEIAIPDRDFVLRIEPRVSGEAASTVVTQRTATGSYGMFTVFPPQARPDNSVVKPGRDILFLLDRSGSMNGARLTSAKLGVQSCLEMLESKDRFQFAAFDDGYSFYRTSWTPANPEALAEAGRFVGELQSGGGTMMQPALAASLEFFDSTDTGREQIIIFLTDGDVGNESELLNLLDAKIGRTRLFTFGVGAAPNAHLIDKMAERGRGQARFIADDSAIARELAALFETLATPVLTDLRLTLVDASGAAVAATVYPSTLRDVFMARAVQAVFAAEGAEPVAVVLEAQRGGSPVRVRLPLQGAELRGDGVAKHFGRMMYEDLEAQRRRATAAGNAGAGGEALSKRMLETALRFQLVTELTSRVAVDREVSRQPQAALNSTTVAQCGAADQTAAAAGGAVAAAEADVIVLSPFVVAAEEDTGYGASSTLAASRTWYNGLSDTASCISVVTQQFLQDTGAKNSEDLLVYTTNTEVGGIRGNYAGAAGNPQYGERSNLLRQPQNTRVRGLDAADNTRDYFLTEIPWDGYNVARVDLQRGPNSILFGLGSPAGIINTALNAAGFRNSGTLETRVDGRGSLRASADVNYVAIDNVLGLRLSALDDSTRYQQKPAFSHDRRVFAALRFDPKLFANGATSLRVNFEDGRVTANRPRSLPPIDRITPWFRPVAEPGSSEFGMGKLTANPTRTGEKYAGGSTIFAHTTMGRLSGSGPALYYNANESAATALSGESVPGALRRSTSALAAQLHSNVVDAPGNELVPGARIGGLDAVGGRYLGVPSMSEWATTAAAGLAGGAYYGDVSLSDASIFDFYKNLLDGDNKREWQRWQAANLALSQTFLDNRVGFELVYDRQRYQDGQLNLLSGSEYAIGVDINTHLIDGGVNPNLGRPYVAASGANSGSNQAFIARDSVRFSAFAELRAADLLGRNTLSTIIGRHIFTGVLEQDKKVTDSRSFSRFSGDSTFAEASGQSSDLNSAARNVEWVAYLGGVNFLTAGSAAGANLPRIKGAISPSGAQAVRYFRTQWNATGVDPAAEFTYTSWDANGNPVTHAGTQVDNPANYVGWTTVTTQILNADKGDLRKLYTAGTENENRIKTIGLTWQGYFWDDLLATSMGWRQATVTNNAASAKQDAQQVAIIDYDHSGTATRRSVGHSLSYGAVLHLKMLDRALPAATRLSIVYNSGENFKADAPRGDVFGNPLGNPMAKTREYGLAVSTLDDRLSLKLTRFRTVERNATLSGATGAGFGENFYQFWASPYWAATQGLAALSGISTPSTSGGLGYAVPNMPPAYVANNGYSWQRIATRPDGSPDGAATYAAVRDFFMNFPLDQNFCDQYGLRLDVAKMHSANPADWFAAVPAVTPTNQNLGAQPLYAGNLKDFGATPSASVDTVSTGWELEATAQLTPGWDLTLNASKTRAVRNALNPSMAPAMKTMTDFFATHAGDIRWWGGPTFREQWNNTLVARYDALLTQQGSQAAELPEWRLNLVTTYRFQRGFLKGSYLGGGYRWEGRRILGYRYDAPAQTLDVANPWYGSPEAHVDLWLGYSRAINSRIDWRIQLNLRNVGDRNSLIPVSVQPDGRAALSRIQEGLCWQLTNTFSF